MSERTITSVPDRQDPEKHRMKYPRFYQLHIDDDRLIIRMVNPIDGKRDCELPEEMKEPDKRNPCPHLESPSSSSSCKLPSYCHGPLQKDIFGRA